MKNKLLLVLIGSDLAAAFGGVRTDLITGWAVTDTSNLIGNECGVFYSNTVSLGSGPEWGGSHK